MKLSKVLKAFSAAALISSLVPYRVTKDEETGEKKYRALLWEVTQVPQTDSTEKSISLQVGFFNPLSKDETHMYADDLAVEYTSDEEEMEVAVPESKPVAEEETETEEAAVEEVAEAADTPSEEEPDDTTVE